MSSGSDRSSTDSTDKVPYKLEEYGGDPEKHAKVATNEVGIVESSTQSFSAEDLEMIYSHLDDRSFEEWLELFRKAIAYHKNDVGIPTTRLELLEALAEGPLDDQSEDEWRTLVRFEAFVVHEWSIYPEVRAVTRPPVLEDDETEEYQSVRAISNGILWGAAGAVIATFFEPRFPSLSIGSTSLQLLIAGTGFLTAKLPRIAFPVGFGRKCVLNTGKPWTYREQMLATLSMSVSNSYPYAQDVVFAQSNQYFYGFDNANNFGYIILLLLSSAFMGFGVGGVFRSAVIYPSKLVYYTVLPTLALSRTLVEGDVRESVNRWKLKRWEFFLVFTVLFFGWYWITNVLLGFLQLFTWMCWAAPNNLNVNAITGSTSGVGMNPFPTFDLNVMGQFAGITTPVWAYTNIMAGLAISTFAVCIMWWTNVSNTAHLPINTNILFDNQGNEWEVEKVLDPSTRKLDEAKYQQYSLPYWSAGNVTSYGAFFMIYPAAFVMSWLNNWKDQIEGYYNIIYGMKVFRSKGRAIDNFEDAFSRRMQRNKEVPEWWFMIILLGSIGMAIGTVEGYKFTDTPVWTIFLGIGLACVFIPMVCALIARTGSGYETNVLYELIVGYALPGNGSALLVGKAYATNFFSQAENWITNQKQAQYVGIAPRTLFWAQCLSTIVTSFVQAGIITWQLGGGIHDMCSPTNKQRMTCQDARTYFNASVMWGVIGPRRVFLSVYPKIKWCFLIGACYPIPFWIVRRFGPTLAGKLSLKKHSWTFYLVSGKFLENINEVLILVGCISYWGAYNWSYVLFDFYVCLFFGLLVKKKWPRWWSKYAYLLTAACSNGTGWAGFFEFWATEYHHIVSLNWWGNNASANTLDANMSAVRLPLDVQSGQYFGPRKGHFP